MAYYPADMNSATCPSEPLADLVRQMLAHEQRPVRKTEPQPVPQPRRQTEALSEPVAMPALKIVEHTPGNFWHSALPAAAVSVLAYLLLMV